MTGRGGWPLNVFLTPEQVPFYAGTYFPPDERHGMPSWLSVLAAVADAWTERKDEIRANSDKVAARLRRWQLAAPVGGGSAGGHSRRRGRPPARDPRRRARGVRRGAEVPARVGDRVPAAPRGDRDDVQDAHGHGRRRHVRPGRRRLRALLRRRPLARSPLREDALRQRSARPGLPARLAGHGRPAVQARDRGDARLGARASCAGPRAASCRRSMPTPRARRASSTRGPPPSCARSSDPRTRRPRPRTSAYTPAATSRAARSSRAGATSPTSLADMRARLYAARAERVWPGLDDKRLTTLERADDLRARRCRGGARPPRLPDAAAACATFVLDRPARRRRAAAAHLEGRRRPPRRVPRGPRLPARGAAHALRGDASIRAGSPPRASSPTRRSSDSPTTSTAASSRPPSITSGWSHGARTSRTTRSRPATRAWPTACCAWRR